MLYARLSRIFVALAIALAAPLALAIDRDEAAARARQNTGGRVLAVEQGQQNGQAVFKVRVLTPSGDVRIVIVDAKTGAVR